MEAKLIRHCIECGKQHNTGIEDTVTGDFERIDKCIDCLMIKCSFKSEPLIENEQGYVDITHASLQQIENYLIIMEKTKGKQNDR